jgi:hypothetical protein
VTQANPAIYEAAMQLVRDGTWVVDHGSGVVYARYGRPIRRLNGDGYLRGLVTLPSGGQRDALLHRVIWEVVRGPIPAALRINHINGVKTDNRPSNLELVTNQQNTIHAYGIGLYDAHGLGENHPRAKLTDEQVRAIFKASQAGVKDRVLAAEYGVSKVTILNIRLGRGRKRQTADLMQGEATA